MHIVDSEMLPFNGRISLTPGTSFGVLPDPEQNADEGVSLFRTADSPRAWGGLTSTDLVAMRHTGAGYDSGQWVDNFFFGIGLSRRPSDCLYFLCAVEQRLARQAHNLE